VKISHLGVLANKLGWESVFYVFGVLGIVWFLFWWWLVYDTPQSHPTISRQEKEYILRSLGRYTSHALDYILESLSLF
jgi:sugar phosphate permease